MDLSLHNRIAVFRAERGISRRQLAEAVGVNNQTIGYLERGDYKPSLELALKIARYFGVAVEMLFSLERFEPIAMTLMRTGEDK
jgi:DNA-binding XRE family transcriptional regulator